MSAVLTRPRRPGPAVAGIAEALRLGVVLLAMALLTGPLLRVPTHVGPVVVSNPHPWVVSVDLVDVDGRSRLSLGPVAPASERGFSEVLDQGVEWVFRFSHARVHADVHRAGAQLTADGRRVTVPLELAERLRAAGVDESAR